MLRVELVTDARAVISIEEIISERLIAALDAEDTPKASCYLQALLRTFIEPDFREPHEGFMK
jgi:hypothetical protein